MLDDDSPRLALRSRVQQDMRHRVRITAIELMLRRGFARTSVDDVAHAAGISRRSFYRYFGTREELVLGKTEDQVATLVTALAAQPPVRALAFARLVLGDPDLRARQLEQRAAWREALAPVIEQRARQSGAPLDEIGANALVAAALSCLDVAVVAWVGQEGRTPLPQLYERAVTAVRGR